MTDPPSDTATARHRGKGPAPLNVTGYLLAVGTGVLADQLFYIVLSWTLLEITGSESLTGLIASLGSLPRALLLLPGGHVAEQRGYRNVAVAASIMRLLVEMLVVLPLHEQYFARLCVTSVLFGVVEAFYLPSLQSMVTTVTHGKDVRKVQSSYAAAQRLGIVAAPMAAGLLLEKVSIRLVFACIALVSFVSLLLLWRTGEFAKAMAGKAPGQYRDTPSGDSVSTMSEIVSALRMLCFDRELMPLLLLVAVSEFAASGLTNAGYTFLAAFRGWSALEMGAVLSAFSAGALCATVAVAAKGARGTKQAIGAAIVVMGIAFSLSGTFPAQHQSSLMAALAGACGGVSSTLLMASYIEAAERFRVAIALSLLNLVSFGTSSVSMYLCGRLSEAMGAPQAFVVFGLLLAFAGAVFACTSRSRRRAHGS